MKKLNDLFFRLAELLLVSMLSIMVVMVFGNVVLRYGFNSGIISSEELSRFLFIWITFLGAVIAMRENAHLGLDSLVRVLPLVGKKACFALSNLLMLICCVLMFYGTWKQHSINATTLSPVVELPMSWVYGVGYVASVAMGLLIVGKLVQLARGQIQESDLIQVHDSEEEAQPHLQGAANTELAGAAK
ncbi:MAG: TRAP transporter small permease [Betaproteobacteria bacterium]|jgi:TRAP-type C4-dicarboxylate transport system permease small subunit|nr:TRAP transporter small permease [Betaproteobacteria bacterium]MBP6645717.1 TRAP transporter small permease [Burkholderiaceae bacterium]